MMQTVMIATAEYAKARPDIIKGLIAARREGLAYTLEHPDESADITARAYNNPNVDLFRRISTNSSRKITGATVDWITQP